MATKAGIFFAGVATTFVILGAGFGGGLFMANSALNQQPTYNQARVAPPALSSPIRVILPSTAEAAQPPQPSVQPAEATPEPQPQVQPAKDVQAPAEKQIDKPDVKKADAEEKERRKRSAERKARRLAAERARRQQQQMAQGERREAPVMAFGSSDPAARPFANFFNND